MYWNISFSLEICNLVILISYNIIYFIIILYDTMKKNMLVCISSLFTELYHEYFSSLFVFDFFLMNYFQSTLILNGIVKWKLI